MLKYVLLSILFSTSLNFYKFQTKFDVQNIFMSFKYMKSYGDVVCFGDYSVVEHCIYYGKRYKETCTLKKFTGEMECTRIYWNRRDKKKHRFYRID